MPDRRYAHASSAVWLPGNAVSRAIPAIYADAEIQATHPAPAPEKGKNKSISKYANEKNQKSMCRPIQDTNYWRQVKNDPIFVNLSTASELWTIQDIMANRARPAATPDPGAMLDDDDREEGEVPESVADNWNVMDHLENVLNAEQKAKKETDQVLPSDQIGGLDPIAEDDDDALNSPAACVETTRGDSKVVVKEESTCASTKTHPFGDVATSIEFKPAIKLEYEAPTMLPLDSTLSFVPRRQSIPPRRMSISPEKRLSISKPSLLPPKQFGKDDAQEDILAKLGVTGAPRPVFSTPGPAYMPPPDGVGRSRSRSPQRLVSFKSLQSSANNKRSPVHHANDFSSYREREPVSLSRLGPSHIPPPPPPPQIIEPPASASHDPWSTGFGHDGSHDSPRSVDSQHTLAGSDFHADEPMDVAEPATIGTPEDTITVDNKASISRKRTRGDTDEQDDGIRRQKDDVTPRLRRRQPKVAAAYRLVQLH